MAKLTNMKPRLGSMGSRLSTPTPATDQERFRLRDATSPGRPWYKTTRWQKLRLQVLQRDLYTCQMCGRLETRSHLLVCDHIKPHRGDEALFWNPTNLQTLCADPCHNSKKQREEAKMPKGVWY